MNKKKKLLISVALMGFVASIIVVAVFASIQQGLSITSDVFFSAKKGVNASYTISLSSENGENFESYSNSFLPLTEQGDKVHPFENGTFIQRKAEDFPSSIPENEISKTVLVYDLIYSIEITNNEQNNPLFVKISEPLTSDPLVTVADFGSVIVDESEVELTYEDILQIEAGETSVFTVTVKVKGANGLINSDIDEDFENIPFNFTVNLYGSDPIQ